MTLRITDSLGSIRELNVTTFKLRIGIPYEDCPESTVLEATTTDGGAVFEILSDGDTIEVSR